MSIFPDEMSLLSLFECEPTLLDEEIPFCYNTATYQLFNGEEDIIVTLSPSYGDVKIQVTRRASKRILVLLDLKQVEKFEITADKKDLSSVLITDDSQQLIEIEFKPSFKLIYRT